MYVGYDLYVGGNSPCSCDDDIKKANLLLNGYSLHANTNNVFVILLKILQNERQKMEAVVQTNTQLYDNNALFAKLEFGVLLSTILAVVLYSSYTFVQHCNFDNFKIVQIPKQNHKIYNKALFGTVFYAILVVTCSVSALILFVLANVFEFREKASSLYSTAARMQTTLENAIGAFACNGEKLSPCFYSQSTQFYLNRF